MADDVLRLLELSQDVLREDLAKLDTHLIKGVDTPDNTLGEDLVLIESDEGTYGMER